jgi:hypothetical protein
MSSRTVAWGATTDVGGLFEETDEQPDRYPHAAIHHDQIELWYGTDTERVLELSPIPLSELAANQ